MYDNQEALKSYAMETMTTPEFIAELSTEIAAQLPISSDDLTAELAQGLESGGLSYTLAKSDLKYGTSRGVFATPSYFINQVPLYGTGSHAEGTLAALTLDEWKELVDPVVNGTALL